MGPREGMVITFSKNKKCDLKIMYSNEDFECQYTLWLVNFIWALFGNAGSLFAIHIRNMILFPFSVLLKNLEILLKAFQILDLNIGLLEILDIPPKCLYLGDAFKVNAGALINADSRYFHSVDTL